MTRLINSANRSRASGMRRASCESLERRWLLSVVTYDLKSQWSDANNPNGVWTYRQGTTALPHQSNWTQLKGTGVQPAWARSDGSAANDTTFLPAWLKATSKPAGDDLAIGDVIVHTTDGGHGVGAGPANAIWKSPAVGTINITGGVWMLRDIGRANHWSLLKNNVVITEGDISSGDAFNRASPFKLSAGTKGASAVQNINVAQNDVIELRLVSTTLAAGGDFVGVNFSVQETTNAPPTIGSLSDSPDPIVAGNPLTLTGNNVADVDGNLSNVKFYRETNNTAGLQTSGATPDTLVGTDTSNTGGWTAAVSTTGLAAKAYTYYALAIDSKSALSNVVSTTNTVQAASDPPPVATLGPANPVSLGGATAYSFTINYTDNTAVKVSTIDKNDLKVLSPTSAALTVTGVTVNNATDGTPRSATYTVTPPGGWWDGADNGFYTISLQANQVSDPGGHFATAKTLGSFAVDVNSATLPTATLNSAPAVTTKGGTSYTFKVSYADNVGIKVSSIGSADVTVTRTGGANVPVTFVAVDVASDGTPRVGTYKITPPGGSWDSADNATYTIKLIGNQVSDSVGNFVPPKTLGTFSVNVPAGALVQGSSTASESGDVGHLTIVQWFASGRTIASVMDDATIDLFH